MKDEHINSAIYLIGNCSMENSKCATQKNVACYYRKQNKLFITSNSGNSTVYLQLTEMTSIKDVWAREKISCGAIKTVRFDIIRTVFQYYFKNVIRIVVRKQLLHRTTPRVHDIGQLSFIKT